MSTDTFITDPNLIVDGDDDLSEGFEVGIPVRNTFVPSSQQQAIFDCAVNERAHIMCIARAGTGKTTTAVEMFKILPSSAWQGGRVIFAAFNKVIANELAQRVPPGVIARTLHSLGFEAVRLAFRSRIQEDKVSAYLKYREVRYESRLAIEKVVSLCKANLLDGENADDLEDLADEYNITLNGNRDDVIRWTPRVLSYCQEHTQTCDYDDMIWLPVVRNIAIEPASLLVVDEVQDLNDCQHKLALKIVGDKGRMVAIGDDKQAIYAFRGALSDSMPRLAKTLQDTERGLKTFPLTVTRRCPKLIVERARQIVPDFEAHEDAGQGEIGEAKGNPELGDMVLCRTNAPLITMAYGLLAQNIPARIQGRDIGSGLASLAKKLAKPEDSTEVMLKKLGDWENREREHITERDKNVDVKLQQLEDKCDCLTAMAEGCATVQEMLDRISSLFQDVTGTGKFVLLSSVHRAKGLEADTVRILHPELMPHPMARTATELQQERNILYVAVTRAKQRLLYYIEED